MTPGTFLHRVLIAAARILGPLLLTVLPYLAWTPISAGLANRHVPAGPWVWVLLLPGLALEWWCSRHLDHVPVTRVGRAISISAMILRLGALCVGFFVLVGRTSALLGTPDIVVPLISLWPAVAVMPYIESPILGGLGLALMLSLHVWLTVHKRMLRMTTTLIIPGLFTLILFHFFYAFPTSPLHMLSLEPDAPVERVFPFDRGSSQKNEPQPPFMAREIFVMNDESTIITSYGATFHFFRPVEDLNLAKIDLTSHEIEARSGRVIRSFRSTCSDKLYAAAWHGTTMLEIEPDSFAVREIDINTQNKSLRAKEIHSVIHDCKRQRVIVVNSRDPVMFVWNTATQSLEKTLNMTTFDGVQVGDHLVPHAVDPDTGDIYLMGNGNWKIIKLSGDTLEPVLAGKLPYLPFDLFLTPDGKFLYATSFVSGEAWKIDAKTLKLLTTFKIPMHSRRIISTTDGESLFVLSYLTGELISYSARTGQPLVRLKVGPKPEGLFVSKHYVWVSAATGIFRVSLDFMLKQPTAVH